MRLLRRISLFLLLSSPLAVWAFFKPVRVLLPELNGVTCFISYGICIDDSGRIEEAIKLKTEAVAFVDSKVGVIETVPQAIFCSTAVCSKKFGFTSNAAYNVGTYGLVVSPRGWQPYFVRHELIHHLQNERMGSLNAWINKPTWFLEGMAYALSEDPRHPLPTQLEGFRVQFETWQKALKTDNLWEEAGNL